MEGATVQLSRKKKSQLIDSIPYILMFVHLVFLKIFLVYDATSPRPYSSLNKSPSLLLCCISPPTSRSSISLSVV